MPSSVGMKLAAFLLDVLALLNRGQDGCVSGRPSHAIGFQFLHQRRFGESRRRFGEVLLRMNGLQLQQPRPRSLPAGGSSTRRLHRPSGPCPPRRRPGIRRTSEPTRSRAKGTPRRHCRPSVTSIVVWSNSAGVIWDATKRIQMSRYNFNSSSERNFCDLFRRAHGRSRPDRFVRVLRVLLALIVVRRPAAGTAPRSAPPIKVAHFLQRVFGNARRVGTHVRDQTNRALFADLDAFIQPLGQHHGSLDAEAQLARRFLLQRRGNERRNRVPLLLSRRRPT